MNLTIFGATGLVGKELVKQALMRNHRVVAFGRNVHTANFPESPALHLIQGALFDETSVREAIKGADAVLSAIGGSIDGTDKARSLGMQNIIHQMKIEGVSRIIAVGGMGVLSDTDGEYLLRKPGYPAQFLAVGEEHLKAYQHLKNSGLDYAFVCCPDIIDAPVTGSFQTTAEIAPQPNSYRITKGDLAFLMLTEAEKGEYHQQRVGICN